MKNIDTMHLVYVLCLLAAAMVWLARSHRHALRHALRNAMLWAFIFGIGIAGVGLWQDNYSRSPFGQASVTETGALKIPRALDGHFYATLDVNGAPIRFLVDTGATRVVLRSADAERAGIDLEKLAFIGEAMTANGRVRTAPVRLDLLALGPFEDRGLGAVVNESEMSHSLLGMTYLSRFERIEITSQALTLER